MYFSVDAADLSESVILSRTVAQSERRQFPRYSIQVETFVNKTVENAFVTEKIYNITRIIRNGFHEGEKNVREPGNVVRISTEKSENSRKIYTRTL